MNFQSKAEQTLPLEFSWKSSSIFSSFNKRSCILGMDSSSFGIRFVDSSLSLWMRLIFAKSYDHANKFQFMKLSDSKGINLDWYNDKCVNKIEQPYACFTFSSFSSSFFIFCFMCFESSLYLTSCLSNSLKSSLHVLRSLSRSWFFKKIKKNQKKYWLSIIFECLNSENLLSHFSDYN